MYSYGGFAFMRGVSIEERAVALAQIRVPMKALLKIRGQATQKVEALAKA